MNFDDEIPYDVLDKSYGIFISSKMLEQFYCVIQFTVELIIGNFVQKIQWQQNFECKKMSIKIN